MGKRFLPLTKTVNRLLGVVILCILGFALNAQVIVTEEWAMYTYYDLQSNGTYGNRVAVWNDGTAAFVATMDVSGSTTWPSRGTGYNYFDGSSMGEFSEERVEDIKSGWPSIAPLGEGEILASHYSGGVNIYKREVKGQGEWNLVKTFNDSYWTWPRIATTHDGQYVHVLFADQEYDNSGVYVNYVAYARSTDYGETWSDPIEPPMVDLEMYNNTLSADDYIMSTNGDRIAILFVCHNVELFYVYSEDNGETWTKQVVYTTPYGPIVDLYDQPCNQETDTIWANDNSGSIAIDNNGTVHVAFGLGRFAPSSGTPGYYTYWSMTNGIVYWNSNYVNEQGGHEIPMFGDWSGDVNHPEMLYNGVNGISNTLNVNRLMEIAEEDNYTNFNVIIPDENHDGEVYYEYLYNSWGSYRTYGMSTMPAISIDESGNMIIAYSALSEERIGWSNNGDYHYRSCLVTARDTKGNWFYDAINLSEDFMHCVDEVYYVTAPTQAYNGNFWVFYCADYEMGLYIDGNNQYDITDNNFYAVLINPSELDGWEGTPSTTHNITVAAQPVYGGTVSGAGTYEHEEIATLIAKPKPGFEFVNWTKNGNVMSTDATYTFEVLKGGKYTANFRLMDGIDYQTYNIYDGWTWWATGIEMGGVDGLAMLEEALGDKGVMISSQANGFVTNYGENGWYGSLENLTNEDMYLVKTDNGSMLLFMVGEYADPADHPITMSPGWTYIGYVPTETILINEALAGLDATEGDIIKSQRAFANYYDGYGWYGSLTRLYPGEGLKYKSLNEEEVTFTYPALERGMGAVEEVAENLHWTVNMHDYPANMTVMAVVKIEDNEVYSSDYELAVFNDGVCRGSVKLSYVEPIDRYVAFLTIGGNDNEELTFGLYNINTEEEMFDSDNVLVFAADAMVGEFESPMVVNFRGTNGVNEINNTVGMYPNPVNVGGYVTVELNGSQSADLEIINTIGAVVAKENGRSIKAPETPGIYMLRITVNGNSQIVKLIVR